MGVLYSVMPLNEKIANYLREVEMPVPMMLAPSRNPTPAEVRLACEVIPNVRTRYYSKAGVFWQASLEGASDPEKEPWTLLNFSKFTGNEEVPEEIWFEKGWPSLILEVLWRLSKHTGPLVVMPDTGDGPIAVEENDTVERLLCLWKHTQQSLS